MAASTDRLKFGFVVPWADADAVGESDADFLGGGQQGSGPQ